MLEIRNLHVSVGGKQILKGVDLVVKRGRLYVLMGPNGSGKSTLAQVIMGNPSYVVVGGRLTVDGKDLKNLSPDKRAKLGIFLGFQHPVEVPGVSVFNVLRKAKQSAAGPVNGFLPASARLQLKTKRNGQSNGKLRAVGNPSTVATRSVSRFRQDLLEYASSLKLSDDFLRRSLNEGFSGGEKKRSEILQMLALRPRLVILDEIDSGLDIDGLKLVASAIKRHAKENPLASFIVITHYARILKYLKPDFVHVMVEGKIVKSGKMSLASEIENVGYQRLIDVIASEAKQSRSPLRQRRIAMTNYNSKFKKEVEYART